MTSSAAQTPGAALYETSGLVDQYLEFHYGPEALGVRNFPAACVEAIMKAIGPGSRDRCLDVGCAVGRSAIELARQFSHVDAIDYSAGFIAAAVQLQDAGSLDFRVPTEGVLTVDRRVSLADMQATELASRIAFATGDACDLPADLTDYDLVFAGNLIDRLYEPQLFLTAIAERIRPGGWLAITSPYTWLEEYTPKRHWLGGYTDAAGNPMTTLAGLTAALAGSFSLHQRQDVPFVIRETARKHQHTLAELTIWQRHCRPF
ncbi:MAG: putative 4-mercaptohistidine N1-methyltransferase [Planctomycetia bacterium]|jgi:putative 4-mercaptohistidine N1-methyltranferase|nr:putative 4-mercaptohistidine N1-methyltransferase [Planctomycetia bacterium]